ncbi:UrvD/REP family ATP-dependent DNA helicase [Schaalia vaccimaxillae]|uniref:UrvD/REP family ATP-dependent DNA helicase n=1 Tax=Schaalia vaccimaxillae TaxID=183916 RepID=UPI00047D9F92|nr:UrvD/REP family ATP-dependent DNA helicase [Schaalia vaccimaxillae]
MSEIDVQLRARPARWATLPTPDASQQAVLDAAATSSVVVRGAASSGRTTTALMVLRAAAQAGQQAMLLVPDRVRADYLTPKVQAILPHSVRPVRTPASLAYLIVSTWRTHRREPLGGVELITGAQHDQLLADLIARTPAPWPESINEQMRAMPGFRAELRDLFARAGEAGLDGQDLIRAGHEFGQEQWVGSGHLLVEYLQGEAADIEYENVLSVDLSRIQGLAASTIDSWADLAPQRGVSASVPIPDVLVVDDLQDCTASTVSLLEAAARQGTRIVALGDSDVAIAGYRGGEPHLDLRLARALGVPIMTLAQIHDQPVLVRDLVTGIAGRITQSGPIDRRLAKASAEEGLPEAVIDAHLTASNPQLGALLARILRAHHLHDGVAWADQAVIVRSASMAEEFTRYLRRGGVPIAGGSQAFDFASQPVTRTLLELVRMPDSQDKRDDEKSANALVTSAFVGLDQLQIQRLLRSARARTEGNTAIGLTDLLNNDELWNRWAGTERASKLSRASAMWELRSQVWSMRPRAALWQMWNAASVADEWKDKAIVGDAESAWYDDQLDAVVALMRVADIWEQRNVVGSAHDFALQLLSGAVPVDTISQVGVRPEGVHVLTPAQAVGRRWPVVCIAGLQDGVWPNLRLRSRMLRADLLADLDAGRFSVAVDGKRELIDDPRSARRAVLDDELRMLALSLSRATQHIHLGAVRTQDAAPSAFFDILARYCDVERNEDDVIVLEEVPAPLDLSGQVAQLRRDAAQPERGADKESAVRLLALLAHEGVPAAQPQRWLGSGGALSTEEPVAGDVVLSPSAFETAIQCPLKWFFSRKVNAEPKADASQQLGTLIHDIAEAMPHGTAEEILTELENRIGELEIDGETWLGGQSLNRAQSIALALADYMAGVPGEVDVETAISAQVEGITIRGRIDRIEHVDDGVRVTDIKTGKKKPTKNEVIANPQLAAYQLALQAQGYDVRGARIAHVGEGKNSTLVQPELQGEEREEWLKKIRHIKDFAAGPSYLATPSAQACQFCSFTALCPAKQTSTRAVE